MTCHFQGQVSALSHDSISSSDFFLHIFYRIKSLWIFWHSASNLVVALRVCPPIYLNLCPVTTSCDKKGEIRFNNCISVSKTMSIHHVHLFQVENLPSLPIPKRHRNISWGNLYRSPSTGGNDIKNTKVLCDLTGYRKGHVGFRWRTQSEVLQGRGQFSCGHKFLGH